MKARWTFLSMTSGVAALMTVIALASPPSGRPPVGALERYEPRVYDFRFSSTLQADQGVIDVQQQTSNYRNNGTYRGNYRLDGAPIMMPIIHLSTFHRVRADSVNAGLWLDNREVHPNAELKTGFPHNTTLATLYVNQFTGNQLRWQVSYNVQVWSSRINEEAAMRIAWPESWPDEVKDGLAPQAFIESDDAIFAQAVQHVSQGKLREVPPYLAAKELVRYCINEIQTTGDGLAYGALRSLMGMELRGASDAARRKLGTPHDLVCVCVATLRAAGIPARPVIGAFEDHRFKRTTFITWGEFYLPDAGWIPFDPNEMRGKGVRTMDVRRPWQEFGTMEDLNRRIPLAYHFIPPADVVSPRVPMVYEFDAFLVSPLWGWNPKPGGDATGLLQIQMTIASRGLGSGE